MIRGSAARPAVSAAVRLIGQGRRTDEALSGISKAGLESSNLIVGVRGSRGVRSGLDEG